MSDESPALIPASPPERGPEALTPDAIESILADFRTWLQEATQAPPIEAGPAFDVATFVQQFTALRQEVNLQTKASRAQLEQNTQALALLQQALEPANAEPHDDQTQDELLRPLLKTLIDAHDSLSLAQREVQRLLDKTPMTSSPTNATTIELRLPYWTRWFGLDHTINKQLAKQHRRASAAVDPGPRFRQMLDALLIGYQMSLQRLERALQQHGLETIPCVGEPFDPETMEVAEVVRELGRSNIEVLDVLRPGYRWHGRLFRYAQVRVAKP
jgi:molecular chaperone GrpE